MSDRSRAFPGTVLLLALALLAVARGGRTEERPAPRLIGPADVLEVTVRGEEDLSAKYAVSDAGTIALPLIGEVSVTGLACDQVKAELERRYGDGYLVKPHVIVSIAESQSETVIVLGQVEKPGPITFRPGLTALRAVLAAGGFTKFAARNKTRIVRGVDAERETIVVKLGDVTNGATEKDVPVRAGDFVIVPESLF